MQAADRFSDSSLMVKLEGGELILDGMPRVSLHLEDTTDLHVSELQILIQNKYFCLKRLTIELLSDLKYGVQYYRTRVVFTTHFKTFQRRLGS